MKDLDDEKLDDSEPYYPYDAYYKGAEMYSQLQPFRVLCCEILSQPETILQWSGGAVLVPTPLSHPAYIKMWEKRRVRAYRIVLEPQQSTGIALP